MGLLDIPLCRLREDCRFTDKSFQCALHVCIRRHWFEVVPSFVQVFTDVLEDGEAAIEGRPK